MLMNNPKVARHMEYFSEEITQLPASSELYLLSAWCFDLFVPLWHDIHTASAFVLPIQGRPCELHLPLLCQTVTRAHRQPGFTQHPRRKTGRGKRGAAEGRGQRLFACLTLSEREHAGG